MLYDTNTNFGLTKPHQLMSSRSTVPFSYYECDSNENS